MHPSVNFTSFLTACLLSSMIGHAYEQDNWYLHGPIDGNLSGVFHQEYNATARKDMLYKTATGVGLEVRTSTALSYKPSIPVASPLLILNTIKIAVDYSVSIRTSSPASSKMHRVDGRSNGGPLSHYFNGTEPKR